MALAATSHFCFEASDTMLTRCFSYDEKLQSRDLMRFFNPVWNFGTVMSTEHRSHCPSVVLSVRRSLASVFALFSLS